MQDVRKIHTDIKNGGVKKIILDTDTYNEIDDQFAIAYMLLSGDKINARNGYGNESYGTISAEQTALAHFSGFARLDAARIIDDYGYKTLNSPEVDVDAYLAAAGGSCERSRGKVRRTVSAGGEADLRHRLRCPAGQKAGRDRGAGTAHAEDAAGDVLLAPTGHCRDRRYQRFGDRAAAAQSAP